MRTTMRRYAALLPMLVFVALCAAPAQLAFGADGSAVVDETAVVVPIGWLTLVVAPFLPYLTALVARVTLPGVLKVGLTALSAAVLAVLTTAIDGGADLIVSWATVITWLTATGTAMLGYVVLRSVPKVGVDAVQASTPGFIG